MADNRTLRSRTGQPPANPGGSPSQPVEVVIPDNSAASSGPENTPRDERSMLQQPIIVSTLDAPLRPPDVFDGTASKLRSFLNQLRAVFRTQARRFPNEAVKTDYAISYLKGGALDWFQPFLETDPPPPCTTDFKSFAAALTEQFGDPNYKHHAADRLYSLRQTTSVSTFSIEFRKHATVLQWDDEVLIFLFYKGLKPAVRRHLFGKKFDSFEAYIKEAIRIDHCNQDLAATDNRPARSTIPAPERSPTRARVPPRDRAPPAPKPAVHSPASPRARNAPRTPRGPLSDEEKQRRRDLNLCMYCGKQDHAVDGCPIRPNPSHSRQGHAAAIMAVNAQGNDPAQSQ